jgi:hypothetical protein
MVCETAADAMLGTTTDCEETLRDAHEKKEEVFFAVHNLNSLCSIPI